MQQIRRTTEARKWHNIKKEPFLIAILWFTWPICAAWILCNWFLENVVRGKFSWHGMFELSSGQECIPVGCVPPTTVVVGGSGGGSASVHAGIDPPWVWAWRPPLVWAWRPPGQTPQLSPWVWAWKPARHAGIPPSDAAMHAGIPPPPPPWTEFLTHATENITLPQTSFAGGNN